MRLIFHQALVFIVTYVSYAVFHCARKSFSNMKSTILDEWTPTFDNKTIPEAYPLYIWNNRSVFNSYDSGETFLGALDTMFLFAYAVGLYISGILGDKYNSRVVLSFGLILTGIFIFLFGYLTELIHFYNIYFYSIFWILNGLVQSTGWPTVVAIMGKWFGKSSHGLVFGVWSSCPNAGNILGAFTVSEVINYGYEYGFLIPSCLLVSCGIISFVCLYTPEEICLKNDTIEANSANPVINTTNINNINSITAVNSEYYQHKKSINIFTAFLLPGVLLCSLSYACLKLVNYAFFFWLPFYLNNKFDWSQSVADQLSIWYDVGGIFGGIIGGIISDKIWSRSPVMIVFLCAGIPNLVVFNFIDDKMWKIILLLVIMGFFIGGAATILSSTITADLGKQDAIKSNEEALATVSGIIDGTGSIGAALGQLCIPLLQIYYGWNFVFYFFILMLGLSCVFILPIFFKDIKARYQRN